MVIGITGNSGAGKTTAAEVLASIIDAKIIDADKIVRQEQKIGKKYYKKIIENFGEAILQNNKEIDRKKLANIIFESKQKMEQMNEITTACIVPIIIKKTKALNDVNVILDVPLLFESNLNEVCDITIGIIADEETKIKRLKKRDKGIDVSKRLKAQPESGFYIKKADYIIENNGNDLQKNMEIIWKKICTEHGKS